MAESLVGTWQRGEIRSTGFYDPAGGAFASSPGEGWWVSLAADGSYRWGEYGHTTDGQGCALTAWLYQEGRLAVAGSHVTFTPPRASRASTTPAAARRDKTRTPRTPRALPGCCATARPVRRWC